MKENLTVVITEQFNNKKWLINNDGNKATLTNEGLTLEIYDQDNLVGFTLSGTIGGCPVYIVHDTDNYPRRDPAYRSLYDEVRHDTIFVSEQFINNSIRVTVEENTGWLGRKKKAAFVVIPNRNGVDVTYKSPNVNTSNFFDGNESDMSND